MLVFVYLYSLFNSAIPCLHFCLSNPRIPSYSEPAQLIILVVLHPSRFIQCQHVARNQVNHLILCVNLIASYVLTLYKARSIVY